MLLLVSEIFIRDKISFIVICGIYFLHKYIYIYISCFAKISISLNTDHYWILIFLPECHFLETYRYSNLKDIELISSGIRALASL